MVLNTIDPRCFEYVSALSHKRQIEIFNLGPKKASIKFTCNVSFFFFSFVQYRTIRSKPLTGTGPDSAQGPVKLYNMPSR